VVLLAADVHRDGVEAVRAGHVEVSDERLRALGGGRVDHRAAAPARPSRRDRDLAGEPHADGSLGCAAAGPSVSQDGRTSSWTATSV
jgi:hypothetical protein